MRWIDRINRLFGCIGTWSNKLRLKSYSRTLRNMFRKIRLLLRRKCTKSFTLFFIDNKTISPLKFAGNIPQLILSLWLQLGIVCLDAVQSGDEVKDEPPALNGHLVEDSSLNKQAQFNEADNIDEIFAEYGQHDDIGDAVNLFRIHWECHWSWSLTKYFKNSVVPFNPKEWLTSCNVLFSVFL